MHPRNDLDRFLRTHAQYPDLANRALEIAAPALDCLCGRAVPHDVRPDAQDVARTLNGAVGIEVRDIITLPRRSIVGAEYPLVQPYSLPALLEEQYGRNLNVLLANAYGSDAAACFSRDLTSQLRRLAQQGDAAEDCVASCLDTYLSFAAAGGYDGVDALNPLVAMLSRAIPEGEIGGKPGIWRVALPHMRGDPLLH